MNTSPNASTAQTPLSELENEVIAFFVDFVRWFGAPKSLGAIYGLLFISKSPICFEQIATRLQMSNGSVSQGLRMLKDLGAVKVSFMPGERRDFFVAEIHLRQLVIGFIRQRVERQLLDREDRLALLLKCSPSITESSSHTHLRERLLLLGRWQDQARKILPTMARLLEG